LDLGRVNLNQNGEYEFNFSGLPSVEFYAQILLGMKHYFNVRPSPAEDKPSWFDDVSVDLVLAENGEKLPVFKFSGTLSQLTWTNVAPKPYASALYARGDSGTDASSFVPKPNAQYKLSLKVRSSIKNAVPAKLMFIGGGWKVEPANADHRFNGLFAMADSNGDKQLSEKEIPDELRASWKDFDANDDGRLSRVEAKAMMSPKTKTRRPPFSSFSLPSLFGND
jgi:hypothetical protein